MNSLNSISKELGYRDVEHLEMNLDGDIELSKYWEIIKELYSDLHRNINMFVSVFDELPPLNVEVIAQSPSGINHITYWRESYGVFMCQAKYEDASDWKWKLI